MSHLHVIIDYTNYRGERTERVIEPIEIGWFTVDQYHKEPQWLLRAYDVDKKAERRFAMKDIHSWRPVEKAAPTFDHAWAEYQKAGYQYGTDALEQVRFGWDIAHGRKPQ